MELTEEEEKSMGRAGMINHERRIGELEKRIEKLEKRITSLDSMFAKY